MTVEQALNEFVASNGFQDMYVYLRSSNQVYKVYRFRTESFVIRQGTCLVFYIGSLTTPIYSTRLAVEQEWDYLEGGIRFVQRITR